MTDERVAADAARATHGEATGVAARSVIARAEEQASSRAGRIYPAGIPVPVISPTNTADRAARPGCVVSRVHAESAA
jgi:hypothetical protein